VYSFTTGKADLFSLFFRQLHHIREGFKMSFDYKRLFKFEVNLAGKQKNYRLYGGVAALVSSVFLASIPLLLIGLILTAEGYVGWCPICSAIQK
jgi:hypothetical protein